MTTAAIEAVFTADLESVWNTVTSLTEYTWRSDIRRIDIIPQGFVEYTADGYSTTFTVTSVEPMTHYAFDMDNSRMHGHWTGLFTEEDGCVTIRFTEEVTAKVFFLKPFVGLYLKKQQAAYVADLHKALGG